MKSPTTPEQKNAAFAYQSLFVPALFGQWSPIVADVAAIEKGDRALDVGCGTGTLAREVAKRVTNAGHVIGLDPNPGMLAVAEELEPSINWAEGVAEALPFLEGTFDAVMSQFSLMFVPDPVKAIKEMLRVMKPSGRLVVAVWDNLKNNPAYEKDVAMLERLAGKEAADALRVPFVLGDVKRLRSLFAEAGLPEIQVVAHAGLARFPSLPTMVEADLRGWLPVMGVNLAEAQISRILEEAQSVLGEYLEPDGAMVFETSALIVNAAKG